VCLESFSEEVGPKLGLRRKQLLPSRRSALRGEREERVKGEEWITVCVGETLSGWS
jgi:hypothetical protein